jgi:enoyl-CoA hydratase/carnithine racemase
MYRTLLVERPRDGVVLVTLNRPERLNAITFEMFDELHDLCRSLLSDADARGGGDWRRPRLLLRPRPRRRGEAARHDSSRDDAAEVENRGQTLATRGDDFREALDAFRAKRPAEFTAR